MCTTYLSALAESQLPAGQDTDLLKKYSGTALQVVYPKRYTCSLKKSMVCGTTASCVPSFRLRKQAYLQQSVIPSTDAKISHELL